MSEEWFYEDHGQQRGPVSREVLLGLVQQGEIGPEHLVWSRGMGGWLPLGNVPGMNLTSPSPSGTRPKKVKTAGMAVASFVCGVLGLNLCTPVVFPALAIIFGYLALGGIKQAKGALNGRGFAIAGLVMGYLFLLVHATLLILVLEPTEAVPEELVIDEVVEQFERGELWELVEPAEAKQEPQLVEDEPVEAEPTGELE